MSQTRRSFLKNTSIASITALSSPALISASEKPKINGKNTLKGLKILFQGDSITDGNRTRDKDWNHIMGHGYAYLIASRLWYNHPAENLMFFNRGISGNRVKDLDARWQEDAIDLQPDIISILIGVNDVLSVVNNWGPDPFDKYEEYFRNILDKTQKKLPETRIVLMEPFILKLGWVNEKSEIWLEELKKRQELAKKLSLEYKTVYVPLQETFEKACELAPANYWIWDGVHPMPAGHELIAREWVKEVNKGLNNELIF